MKLSKFAGATSEIWQIFIADSSSTTGAGLTGLVFNSGSLTAYYHRDTDTTATAIALVTMSVGTFTSSGFKEIDATNMPGWYQLCPPNAALAAGAKGVTIHLKGATNMAPLPIEVQLVAVNFDVAAVPNAVAGASGGLLISGSNAGTTTLAALTVTGATTLTGNVSMAAGLNITQSSSNTSALVVTGNGTGSGAVFTSGSGATGDGVKAVAASTNGNGLTLTKTGSGKDFNATSTPLTLAKTTNITGFNDIAAGDVWDVAISGHLTAGTTGLALNSAGSAGDPWGTALPGAYGAGTAGNILGNNLNATITSRMATYTQPTGFLAATFPSGTVANTTNITAGTITTVTNLTNAATAGDFTATMKTSIGTAVAASAVASVTGNVGGNVVGSVASVVGAVGSVTAGVTVTTNNDKTGYSLSQAFPANFSSLSITAGGKIDLGKINGTTVNGNGGVTPWGP